jgi:hypothetical protein
MVTFKSSTVLHSHTYNAHRLYVIIFISNNISWSQCDFIEGSGSQTMLASLMVCEMFERIHWKKCNGKFCGYQYYFKINLWIQWCWWCCICLLWKTIFFSHAFIAEMCRYSSSFLIQQENNLLNSFSSKVKQVPRTERDAWTEFTGRT